MTSARSFLFDGTSLKSLGFSLCSFDGGGEDRLPLFYVPAYTTERPAGHYRWHVTGSHYEEPLSFTLSFARLCQEDPTVSVSQERALARWLTASPDYREFSFEDFDSGTDPLAGITYFVHVTSLEKEMLGGRCLGFTAGFAADSPFGYTAPVTKALSPGTASISVTSDLPQPLYPALSITASAAGDVYLKNNSNGSFSRLDHLSAGEVVTMDKTGAGLLSSRPDHNILDDFDKNWFSLSDGANSITLEGSASVTLTYREPRKVGV